MAVNRLTGMYSGLDTETLIGSLMESKRLKVTNIKKDQDSIKYKQDAWKEINTKAKNLFASIGNLRFGEAYSKRVTNVSDSSVASVVTSDSAMLSTQNLKVTQMASSGYLTGGEVKLSGDTKATSGTLVKDLGIEVGKSLSITTGGNTKDITITEDMTINSLVSELKSAGVDANFDSATQRFFVGARESGEDADFEITGEAIEKLGLGSTAKKIEGRNGKIELNGVEFESKDNTFEVNGLTITAKSLTKGEGVTLNTTKDTSAVYDTIKKFVKQYSELMNEMDKLYNFDKKKNYKPLSDDEKAAMSDNEIEKWEEQLKNQALAKDSGLYSLSQTMREAINSGVVVNGKMMYLSDFGIEEPGYFTSAANEKHALHIKGDEDDSTFSSESNKLKYMITSDPDSVASFFSGMMKKLYTNMNNASKKMDGYRSFGSFYNDVQMSKDYTDYTSKIASMEEKLAKYEDNWYKKFSKMETAMAKMQSSTTALGSMFSN